MPNRFIKECCRSSPTLQKLNDFQERLFWRLLTMADDYGRFEADPTVVLNTCFPLGIKQTKTDVSKCLQLLAHENAVLLYVVNGRAYGQFTNFIYFQGSPRAKKSKHPSPEENQQVMNGCEHMQADANICEQTQTNAPSSVSVSESEYIVRFEIFYKSYPKKESKKDALKVWLKIAPDNAKFEEIMAGLEAWKKTDQWVKDENTFVPQPVRWLRGEKWKDEVKVPVERTQEKLTGRIPTKFVM